MAFNSHVVKQGQAIKKQAEETPTSFATEGGASFAMPTGGLAKDNDVTRFAGPGGAYAQRMMSDPELAMKNQQWNQQFAQSNQGMQFNMAKIQMMGA